MTVQGPVKEQQPDGMSHRGGRGRKDLESEVRRPERSQMTLFKPHSRGVVTCRAGQPPPPPPSPDPSTCAAGAQQLCQQALL